MIAFPPSPAVFSRRPARRHLPTSSAARSTAALLLLAAWFALPALAQVRVLTLGIDVNCPPGLGECWGKGIREGVAQFEDIAALAEDADGATQTARVRTRGDGLLDLNALAAHLEAIRFGARLRGAEAIVDGWLEQTAEGPTLKLFNTGQTVRLAPLTTRVEWDRRKGSAFPASDAERRACETLVKSWPGGPQVTRVIGPVRAADGGGWILEVREAYHFTSQPPELPALTLGIRVNSPYGLGEPWAELRENLRRFSGIGRVAEAPDNERSTATVHLRDGCVPALPALDAHLQAAGIGAQLTGAEATLEGRLVRQHSQLFLKPDGSVAALPLAPLTRKIQWDHRQRREVPATSVESEACARLADQAGGSVRLVRVTGPLAQTGDGRWTLLEVREFDLNPRAAGALAAGRTRDTTPPAPVDALAAIVRPDGSIHLEWEKNEEPDVAGYHVYRSSRPGGRFVKVNRQPVKAVAFDIPASRTAAKGYYAVTVVDRTGNESARSAVTDARPPAAPKSLVATAGNRFVRLEWDAVEAVDLDSYTVRRAESPGGPYAVITVGVTGNAYIDHGAANGRTYFYVVTAVDGSSNESAFSNESSAVPSIDAEAAPTTTANISPRS